MQGSLVTHVEFMVHWNSKLFSAGVLVVLLPTLLHVLFVFFFFLFVSVQGTEFCLYFNWHKAFVCICHVCQLAEVPINPETY